MSTFWYLFAHPEAAGFQFERPLALVLLLPVILFFIVPKHVSALARALRTTAYVAVVLALGGLRFTVTLPDHRLRVVAAVDLSDSIDNTGRNWAVRYLNELSRSLAPEDQLAVLTFAGQVNVARPFASPAPVKALAEPGMPGITNVEQALLAAASLLSIDGDRHVVLLTDGNETTGTARRVIAGLHEAGIPVAVAVPPQGVVKDVQVLRMVVEPIIAEERVFPLRVIAHNSGGSQPAVLRIFLDDVLVDSSFVQLEPGLNRLEFPYRLQGAGSHRLAVSLDAPEDEITANNRAEAAVTLTEPSRLLVATAQPRSVLAEVLQRKGLHLDTVTPQQLPSTIESLLAYHGVLLDDVGATGVAPTAWEAIERYVRVFGGGLVVAGGPQVFGDARLKGTPLERLLPVTLEPRRPSPRSREPLALFLVIDRSNSMGYNSRVPTLRDGEKLRYAKEAALAVVRQLKDQDFIGVIAFDSEQHPIAPLRPLRDNRALLLRDIPRIVENGGTDFYDALQSARDQLIDSRVNRRHIILLTDGDTNRHAEEHYPLIEEIAAADISVTTIRIGNNDVNLELLQNMSNRTGGQFYHVPDVTVLPDLLLRDTSRALGPPRGQDALFYPEAGMRSEILSGLRIKEIPGLSGYAYSRARHGADVVLRVNRLDHYDPLLAVWRYGLGRVAAFTASPSDDAEIWPAWQAYSKFWSQLVHWTVRSNTPWDYAIDVRVTEGETEFLLHTFSDALRDFVLLARLDLSETDRREVPLLPVGPRLFSGRMPAFAPGRYPLTVFFRRGADKILQRTSLVTVPAAVVASSDEYRRRGPNLPLLTEIAEATGGQINAGARSLFRRRPGTRQQRHSLDFLLIPTAMLSLLGDIAARRMPRSFRA